MKKAFALIFLLSLINLAHAQFHSFHGKLEHNMELMDKRIKKITRSANEISQYPSLVVLAEDFTKAAEEAKTQVPPELELLAPEEKEIRKDLYLSMLDDAAILGKKLAEALRSNDKIKVNEILTRLQKAKTEGHKEFKHDHSLMNGTLDFVNLPPTLKDTMKAVGASIKKISMQASDTSLNGDSSVLAQQVSELLVYSKKFTPDLIKSATPNQQQAMKEQYDLKLDEAANLAKSLSEAFQNNDSARIQTLLSQLDQSKKSGHADFK